MATRLSGLALLLQANAALAHPGHGASSAASWLHGLEPAHLAPAVALLGAAALAGFVQRRRAASRERNR